jgi:hypothetical protein
MTAAATTPEEFAGLEPGRIPEPGRAPGPMTEIATHTIIGRYLRETSQPIYSLLFLIPLLGLYELIAVVVNFDRTLQIRNAADIMVKNFLLQFGIHSMLGFMLAVVCIAVVCALVALKDSEGTVRPKYFFGMIVESLFYSMLLGTLASRFTDLFLGGRLVQAAPAMQMGNLANGEMLSQWMIALGAGVYEEIVFRVLLISVFLAGFDLLSRIPFLRWLRGNSAAMAAAFCAALTFSAFHYMGVHGEAFLWSTFVYRFFAGLILSAVYVLRGLGIAAWTHAFYDVMILLGIS